MTEKIINDIRVLTPASDMWLCDKNAHVASDEVWLGVHDTPDRWEEITVDEKTKLEAEWESELPSEPPTPSDRLVTIEQTQLEQDAALMELAEMLEVLCNG